MVKACIKCNKVKGLSLFGIDRRQSDGRRGSCRVCYNAWLREHRKKDHVKKSIKVSKSKSRRKAYGITLQQYEKLLAKQKNKCAICKSSAYDSLGRSFAIDHCHSSGKVRGATVRILQSWSW